MSGPICLVQQSPHTNDLKKKAAKCTTFAIMDDVSDPLDPAKSANLEGFRRRRRQSFAKPINAIWELFSEYSNGSTIHGLRYLGEKRRHWSERIWWAIACLLSLVCCGHLILQTWQKWNQFPVLVTFAEKSTHIDQIPFPAITICPSTKVKQSVFNYTTAYQQYGGIGGGQEQMSAENLTTLRAVSYLCYQTNRSLTATNQSHVDDCLLRDTLGAFVPTLQEVIYSCSWRGRKKAQCTEYFRPIWTSEGVCYSFNLLEAAEMFTEQFANQPTNFTAGRSATVEKLTTAQPETTSSTSTTTPATGTPKPTPLPRQLKHGPLDSFYPRRVAAASDALVLEMRLFDKDTDYLCEGPVQGFKLLLHGEHEQPQPDKYFYRVPLDHEVIVSVKPELMETSSSLRHYSAERRQCYFGEEKRLRFMKIYSQRNCELECLTRKTLRMCKCVTFGMPRNSSTRVCGLSRKICYTSIQLTLDDNCDCLPACRSISYEAELSAARYNRRRFQHGLNRTHADRRQYVRLAVSFKDNQFFASHRRELYGRTDFLANCGGLLGLFMGFSLLSIVEVVYYCTLRLFCNLRRRREAKRKAGSRRPLVVEKY